MMAAISEELAALDPPVLWDAVQHRVRCNGHCVNLAMQAFMSVANKKAVDEVIRQSKERNVPPQEAVLSSNKKGGWSGQKAIQNLKEIFTWIRGTTKVFAEFVSMANLTPILPNNTRWNSWYIMIKRGLATRVTVNYFTTNNPECAQPFFDITKATEGDNVTLDKVLYTMDFLRSHYKAASEKYKDNTQFHTAIITSWYAFDKWYAATDLTPVYTAAVLLQPQLRATYLYQEWEEEWYIPAIERAKQLWLNTYKDKKHTTKALEPSQKTKNDNDRKLSEYQKWRQKHKVVKLIEDEFEDFIKSEPTEDLPLDYWLDPQQQRKYPNLYQMALDILSIYDKGGYRQINKSLNICEFDDYLKGQTARLPQLVNVEQLTPGVLRVLGQHPGKFTFQGTNTYIVGTGQERLIIDTSGGEPEWTELIKSTLKSIDISLSYVLLTHWHGDHTGGVPDLIRLYQHLRQHIYKSKPDRGQQNITDGQIFQVEGATVRAIHVPGHSEDHMCFILEEEQAMFTGDNILGYGTSAVEDLGTFMASLQSMSDQQCAIGYSAHGVTIANLPAKIGRELEQKLRRKNQVIQALGRVRSRGEKSVTVQDLVTEIYGASLDEETRTLVLEPFIGEVLRKLAGDGKVAFEMRGGKRKWFFVGGVVRFTEQVKALAAVVNVQVASLEPMPSFNEPEVPELSGSTNDKYLCLTICGYRKPGMSEEAYRNHMVKVSAPMTKGLMVKYDFDCFSQVIFKSVEDYKRMKQDPWYKEHLVGDHEKFADTKRSVMTIGWVEEFVRDGEAVDGFEDR
ncbi:hypothetical protein B0A49_08118 [Cryomyces minteri]|uniref:Metallo-beta-lactamase domain-containing protein n=1 Tax=Cryomyces minteri TaxID=331657 RepID=A0A4U0WRF4_9PEZI|nr:hypothetical protein B0A49_08118 [Cryomyces minteri]